MKNKKFSVLKKFLSFVIVILSITILCGCGSTVENIDVDSIEISKKNLYLAEGQTAVISAQVYPFNATNQQYTFESSNNSIVTIEDGFVSAKKAGNAVIYVYSEDGGYKDSCNVLVTKVSDNLSINNYNNLNMPPKQINPIYNSDDYAKSNENDDLKNTMNQIVKKVNAEVADDVDAGKKVFEDIKRELTNSINSLQNEKENITKNMADFGENCFVNSFNKLRCDMIDIFNQTKQEIIDEIDDITNKVETGEYVTESKNINGVTFVTIRANNNTTNGVGNDDNLR